MSGAKEFLKAIRVDKIWKDGSLSTWEAHSGKSINLIEKSAADKLAKEVDEILYMDECRCDDAWTKRDRHAPNAICGFFDDLRKALKEYRGES